MNGLVEAYTMDTYIDIEFGIQDRALFDTFLLFGRPVLSERATLFSFILIFRFLIQVN